MHGNLKQETMATPQWHPFRNSPLKRSRTRRKLPFYAVYASTRPPAKNMTLGISDGNEVGSFDGIALGIPDGTSLGNILG